jgi:alpha-ketoglutarate-dependent taurine dioxygenase
MERAALKTGQALTGAVLTPYGPGEGLPLFVQPAEAPLRDDAAAARAWFFAQREAIEALLPEAGALVFRGFPLWTTAAFAAWMEAFEAPGFDYTGGAAPREAIAQRVFETTRVPAEQVLGLHQEMAYLPNYPARIAFWCRIPSAAGGETFLADMRRVTRAIDPAFLAEVKRRGVRYTRNFRDRARSLGHPYLDVYHRTWQDAFATTEPEVALAAARGTGLEAEWLADGSLSTIYRAPGIVRHPLSGEPVWFNQIATQRLGPRTEGEKWPLYAVHYAGGAPLSHHAAFGDGEEFSETWMASLYAALDAARIAFPWSAGDVLLIDNHLTAHGRNAFTGLRDVQVALLK